MASVLDTGECCKGIYVDHRDRTWVWDSSMAMLLDDSSQLTITSENSGITESGVIDSAAVDQLDQVWILTSGDGGVSVASLEAIQTVPEDAIVKRNSALGISQYFENNRVFIPALFLVLWLIAILNLDIWQGVAFAVVIGLVAGTTIRSFGYLHIGAGGVALIFGLTAGIIAGLQGRELDKKERTSIYERKNGTKYAIIFTLVGLLLGSVYALYVSNAF